MENEVEIVFNYDFDPEQGYTTKSIKTNEYYMYQNMRTMKQKVIVNLYEEDIKALLEGTGVDLDAE